MDVFDIHDDDSVSASPFTLHGAKFGFYESAYWPNAGSGTRGAMARAKQILRHHGAVVEELELPDDFSRILGWHATILAKEGQSSFLGQYRTNRSALHGDITGHVENATKMSRTAQLKAYDECARLRPVFDEIARGYAAIITPSVVDEAPADINYTGDMVE